MSKNLGIVGSGPSGLVSAKEALKEGFQITIFERNPSLGGVWNQQYGQSWSTMQTNISRFTTVFSENPWNDCDPIFPLSNQVIEYLENFAIKYSINEHIKFNTVVVSIHRSDSKWFVKTMDSLTNKECNYEFDYVIVATGIFSKPYFPDFQSTSSIFEGLTLHSQFYNRNKCQMKDKKVLIIGSSFSSSEIAADLVGHAQSVTNIIRKPYWIIPRYFPTNNGGNLPVDFEFYSQRKQFASIERERNDPIQANISKNQYFRDICADQRAVEGLNVNLNENESPKVSISESFVRYAREGKIHVKQGEVSHFNRHGLSFRDDSVVNADIVIYCTGYLASLDFFDENIKRTLEFDENDQLQPILLHKCTFHHKLKKIAFVGMYRGPFFGVIELQALWAVRTFVGRVQLHDEEMIKGIESERRIRNKNPRPQFPHDYVKLANSIAEELGLLPDFDNLKITDPELYTMLWEGVTVPDLYKFNENRELTIASLSRISEIKARMQNT